MSAAAPHPLPSVFVRNVEDAYGEVGGRWLASLPRLVGRMAEAWELDVGRAFPSSYNYVAPARRHVDGASCVLKLGLPDDRALTHEAAALAEVDGEAAVRLLAHDPEAAAVLLERAQPGSPLADLVATNDDAATMAIAAVLRRFWRPAPAGLERRSIGGLVGAFARYRAAHRGSGPLPGPLVDRARAVFGELVVSAPSPQVLLHGDLHHGNVLRHSDRWLAIDPKGLVGDIAFDTWPLLHNPHAAGIDVVALLDRRIAVLAEQLPLERDRITAWGFAGSLLSELWSVEDHGSVNGPALAVAEVLVGRIR